MPPKKKSRPDKVSNAITLLWISLAIDVIDFILDFSSPLGIANTSGLDTFMLIFPFLLACLLLAYFIGETGQGRNWTRILLLVLFILGIPFEIYTYLILEVGAFSIFLGIIDMTILIVAFVFLFQKQSSDWFKSMKK